MAAPDDTPTSSQATTSPKPSPVPPRKDGKDGSQSSSPAPVRKGSGASTGSAGHTDSPSTGRRAAVIATSAPAPSGDPPILATHVNFDEIIAGVNLLWNGKFTDAEQIFSKHKSSNPRYALHYAEV